jgi:hypothetical protein
MYRSVMKSGPSTPLRVGNGRGARGRAGGQLKMYAQITARSPAAAHATAGVYSTDRHPRRCVYPDPRVSLPLLAAHLRLRLAYALTCKEWLDGNDVGTCLSLEVVELIGQHCTCTVAVLGLLRPLNEGAPPSA